MLNILIFLMFKSQFYIDSLMVESKAALETKKRRREVEVGPDSAGFFHPDSARFRIFPWISLI